MKKENRKLAQQRRAEERRKKEQIRKMKKSLCIGLPIFAILIFAILLFYDPSDSSSDADSVNTETQTDSSDYLTDTSLTIENGDTVNIDYTGSIDGTEFDGGSTNGTGTELVIGSGSYIDDFEEQLIGHHPGETVDVTVTFPQDYGQETLNGKDALFQVTINGIYPR